MPGRLAFLVFALHLWVPLAGAQALVGLEFQVVSHTETLTSSAALASDPDGNFVVVWEDDVRDTSVFGRRFDVTGTPRGSDFRVNSHPDNYQVRPAVASDATGRFVVVWASAGQDGSSYGIFGQRYDADGAAEGPEFRVNATTLGYQFAPDVAGDAGGNFVVVWQSRTAASGLDIVGQRYDASGAPLGSEFLVNSSTAANQRYPAVAWGPSGNFVVAWEGGAGAYDVLAQRFDSSGARLGAETRVNTYTPFGQFRPDVGYDAAGDFVIAWESDQQDGSGRGIFGQRYDASGLPLGSEFRVNSYTTGMQHQPSVACAADGGFAVVWGSEGQDDSEGGIFGRIYDASGEPRGTEFRANEFMPGNQAGGALTAQPDGRFAVVWTSHSSTHDVWGPGEGTFGRRFEMPPDFIFADGFESGSLSAWSTAATDDGDLAVSADAALKGTAIGVQGAVDDTAGLYVEDATPSDENRYRARFYFDPNGFDPGESGGRFRTRIFIAFEEAPARRLITVVLKRQGGIYSIMSLVRLDDGLQADTGFFPVSDAPLFVEFDWHRSSAANSNDGFFHLWIDGTLVSTLPNLDNRLSAVDFVRLGAQSVKTGASGTIFWDEFESRRESEIGP